MDVYESVLRELREMFEDLFSINVEDKDDFMKKPIYCIFGKPNATNWLYLLLELSKRFQIPLTNDLAENMVYWNLNQLVDVIIQLCPSIAN